MGKNRRPLRPDRRFSGAGWLSLALLLITVLAAWRPRQDEVRRPRPSQPPAPEPPAQLPPRRSRRRGSPLVRALGWVLVALLLMASGVTTAFATFARDTSVRASAQATPNLLGNPGAEVGAGAPNETDVVAIPGWETSGSFTAVKYGTPGFPTLEQAAAYDGGANLFAGGPANDSSTASQVVGVQEFALEIDDGRVDATLSALIGGFSSQEDAGTVAAIYRNGADEEIGRTTIGPVTAADRDSATSLEARSATEPVPAGTRSIRVVLTATRAATSYNDGYFDNLSLTLATEAAPENTPPDAVDDTLTVTAGESGEVDLLDNDTDADGDALTVTDVGTPKDGTLECDGGLCTYRPNDDFTGTDGFDYGISDGQGGSDTAHVTINVTSAEPVDLVVGLVEPPVIGTVGQNLQFRFRIENRASVTATGVQLAGHIPNKADYVSSTIHSTDGECLAGEGAFDCAVGSIPAGDSTLVDIVLEPLEPGVLAFSAGAQADEPESNEDDNFAGVEVTILTGGGEDPPACPQVGAALDDAGIVVGESWVECSAAAANGTVGQVTHLLPPSKGSEALLTSGSVAGASGSDEADASNGTSARGANDVSILKLDLLVPEGANCLAFDFVFGSEEYPDFVGSAFNDAFIAELDTSDWQLNGSTITAPHNFAFDDEGRVISINSGFFASDKVVTQNGSQYNGATPRLRARTAVTPGAHSLYLSIFDAGDDSLDSGAFVDYLTVGNTSAGGCEPGADENHPPAAVDDVLTTKAGEAKTLNVVGNDTDPDGDALAASNPTDPPHGSAACGGASCTYTPDEGYTGTDSFDYTVGDGRGGTDTGTVQVTVEPAELPPFGIRNGTFDTDAAEWTLIQGACADTHWTSTGNPGGGLQLNSCGETSAADPGASQTVFRLVPGERYELTGEYVSFAPGFGDPGKQDALGVLLDGQEILGLPRPSPDPNVWTPFSVSFTATAASATLTFEAERDGDDSSFLLDNLALAVDQDEGEVDLELTKSDSADPVTVGHALTYTLAVTNRGDATANDVRISDRIPDGVRIESLEEDCSADGQLVTCIRTAIPPEGSVDFDVVVVPEHGGPLSNTATVVAAEPESNTQNNGDTETTSVVAPALTLTKTDTPDPATVGEPVTYTLRVANAAGAAPATDVRVFDSLPDGATLVSASDACDVGEGIACDVGGLAAGAASEVQIVVTFAEPGAYTNDARAVSDEGVEAVASATTTVVAATPPPPPPPPPPAAPPAELSFSVSISPESPAIGDVVTYTITVRNNGPGVANGVTVLHEAPASALFLSAETTQGSCAGSQNVVCSLGTLQPATAASLRPLAVGDTAVIVHRVRVTEAGPAESTVTVAGGEPDPDTGNNRQTTSVSVLQQPPPPPPPPPGPPVDPKDPDDGVPNPNETVVVQEVAGRVLVKLPGTDRFVDLSQVTEIPNGTLVDARNGRFRLTAAASGGDTDQTVFYDGLVEINQTAPGARVVAGVGPQPGVTELRLAGGDFGRPCTTALAKAKAKAKAKKKPKRRTFGVAQTKPVKPVRRLWGNGGGNFRTRGRYSSATVRGTFWLTEDYCNGTLVRVRQGIVAVRDLVKRRTVLVTAGKSYFAAAPAPKAAKAKRRG